jgi:hypothetical protein
MLVYDNDRERLWRVFMVVLLFQLHSSIRTPPRHCSPMAPSKEAVWQAHHHLIQRCHRFCHRRHRHPGP